MGQQVPAKSWCVNPICRSMFDVNSHFAVSLPLLEACHINEDARRWLRAEEDGVSQPRKVLVRVPRPIGMVDFLSSRWFSMLRIVDIVTLGKQPRRTL